MSESCEKCGADTMHGRHTNNRKCEPAQGIGFIADEELNDGPVVTIYPPSSCPPCGGTGRSSRFPGPCAACVGTGTTIVGNLK